MSLATFICTSAAVSRASLESMWSSVWLMWPHCTARSAEYFFATSVVFKVMKSWVNWEARMVSSTVALAALMLSSYVSLFAQAQDASAPMQFRRLSQELRVAM